MPVGRVQSRSSFTALRSGRRARSGALRVTFVPATSTELTEAQIAFGIGRQLGNAVVRNRLRRRLRAVCAALDPAPGLYLVTAAPDAVTCDYAQLRNDLATALASLGALPEAAA